MNEGINSPCSSVIFDSCEPSVYQQYIYDHAPITIPQIYAGDEVIKYMVPNSPDDRFLILYPNNGNINLSGISGRNIDTGTQTVQWQTDYENTGLGANQPEAATEKVTIQHPGFILLSVKHEKIREGPSHVRAATSGFKGSGLPVRKMSRKRLRKMTPSSINSGALLVDGVGFLSAEDATKLASNMTEQPSTLSRFRVTRIADASSWWIPNNASMNICVHDLKTSSLPDMVARQYQKLQNSISYSTLDRTKWDRDFWKYLGPDYVRNIMEDTSL